MTSSPDPAEPSRLSAGDTSTLAHYAMRYALGRATFAVEEVCSILERMTLSDASIALMLRDLAVEFDRDDRARIGGQRERLPLGMDQDRRRWQALREVLLCWQALREVALMEAETRKPEPDPTEAP